jgi:hypothetical protein
MRSKSHIGINANVSDPPQKGEQTTESQCLVEMKWLGIRNKRERKLENAEQQ